MVVKNGFFDFAAYGRFAQNDTAGGFICAQEKPSGITGGFSSYHLLSPKKNSASVPGPEWEPITAPV